MASRISQEAVEVVLGTAADVRLTQETLEVVLVPGDARVSQEVVEVVLLPGAAPPEPNAWTVRAAPRVDWGFRGVPEDEDGIVVADPHHPRGKWAVNAHPRIAFGGDEFDPYNRFFVESKPKVSYVTGPGTASTECISGDGVVPPPDEPPAESLEENYVF